MDEKPYPIAPVTVAATSATAAMTTAPPLIGPFRPATRAVQPDFLLRPERKRGSRLRGRAWASCREAARRAMRHVPEQPVHPGRRGNRAALRLFQNARAG